MYLPAVLVVGVADGVGDALDRVGLAVGVAVGRPAVVVLEVGVGLAVGHVVAVGWVDGLYVGWVEGLYVGRGEWLTHGCGAVGLGLGRYVWCRFGLTRFFRCGRGQ